MSENQAPNKFIMQNVYLEDASLEVKVPIHQLDPATPLNRNVDYTVDHINENNDYTVKFKATVEVKANDKLALIVEVTQAANFTVEGYDNDALQVILKAECPMILFPFLREKVASLTANAGYPNLFLEPINFHAQLANEQQKNKS